MEGLKKRIKKDVGLRDMYEERAAIREFCGGMNRYDSERLALLDCQEFLKREENKSIDSYFDYEVI